MAFELPQLPYASDALEPHFDKMTMEIHHGKHHAAYTANLNGAIQGTPNESKSIEELLADVDALGAAVRNNGGGYYNHNMFWESLSPKGGGAPKGELAAAIDAAFGSFDAFKETFAKAGATRFGSGWAWLCVKGGKLEVCSSANQDNPLMPGIGCGGFPVLGLDVWEHAYYLNYQNKRADYLDAFWSVLDWSAVERKYEEALSKVR